MRLFILSSCHLVIGMLYFLRVPYAVVLYLLLCVVFRSKSEKEHTEEIRDPPRSALGRLLEHLDAVVTPIDHIDIVLSVYSQIGRAVELAVAIA